MYIYTSAWTRAAASAASATRSASSSLSLSLSLSLSHTHTHLGVGARGRFFSERHAQRLQLDRQVHSPLARREQHGLGALLLRTGVRVLNLRMM